MAENALMRLTAIDGLPVARSIVDHLQQMILQGDVKPGDRLPSQRELAGQLGVSRPSLREALTALETKGLVRVRAGSGVFVARAADRAPLWRFADRCSPRDVYEARYGLEGFAARLAACRVDRAAELQLGICVDNMQQAFAHDDLAGMARSDAAFHDLIFELSANPILAAMYRPVREMMVESQQLPMTLRERLGETPREHAEICRHLVDHDPDGAEVAMHEHIRAAAARYGLSI